MTTNSSSYWTANLKLIRNILIVWFVVSFGFGIILVDVLNYISIGGYKLGFWFAQQGSILVFIGLIFYYARKINQIDKQFNVAE